MTPTEPDALVVQLSAAGFVAAEDEAQELRTCAAIKGEPLDALVERRLSGEPLAWITGQTLFCGLEIRIDRGVYVPRWQSEPLARRAVERLPTTGMGIDLCSGSGAIARMMATSRPGARVVASEIDEVAVACAAGNGIEVYRGDLFSPLPRTITGLVDVVVGVVPYVPTTALPMLSRDTFEFESELAYDGGPDGCGVLRRVAAESPGFLRLGGALLLELGGDQAEALTDDLSRSGFGDVTVFEDEEGDVRGIEATLEARK